MTEHYVDGHAFIADGYVKYENMKDPYYLHLNMGWGPEYNFNIYVLTSKKHWDKEQGEKYYGKIFPHKLRYGSFTYPNEKNW